MLNQSSIKSVQHFITVLICAGAYVRYILYVPCKTSVLSTTNWLTYFFLNFCFLMHYYKCLCGLFYWQIHKLGLCDACCLKQALICNSFPKKGKELHTKAMYWDTMSSHTGMSARLSLHYPEIGSTLKNSKACSKIWMVRYAKSRVCSSHIIF